MKKSRILSLLLAVMLVLSSLPVTTFASNSYGADTATWTAVSGDTELEVVSIDESAITADESGDDYFYRFYNLTGEDGGKYTTPSGSVASARYKVSLWLRAVPQINQAVNEDLVPKDADATSLPTLRFICPGWNGNTYQASFNITTEWQKYETIIVAGASTVITLQCHYNGAEDVVPFDVCGVSFTPVDGDNQPTGDAFTVNGTWSPKNSGNLMETVKKSDEVFNRVVIPTTETTVTVGDKAFAQTEAVFDGLGETVAITGSDDVTLVPGKYTLTASFRLGWFDHAKLVMKSNKYEIAENNNNAVLNAYFGSESIGELTINPDTWTELTYSFDITAPTKMSEFKFELDDVAALDYKIETVDVLAADRAAAQIVIDAIDKIADVTLDDGDAIATAEAAYEALTPTQKELVTNYETLTAARATYDALVETQIVIDAINAIGEVTLADGDAIAAAEAAYEALTPAQQELVTNYETLTAARATYDVLFEAAEKAKGTAVSGDTELDVLLIDESALAADKSGDDYFYRFYNLTGEDGAKYIVPAGTFTNGGRYKMTVWLRTVPDINEAVNEDLVPKDADTTSLPTLRFMYSNTSYQLVCNTTSEWQKFERVFIADSKSDFVIKCHYNGAEDVVTFDACGISFTPVDGNDDPIGDAFTVNGTWAPMNENNLMLTVKKSDEVFNRVVIPTTETTVTVGDKAFAQTEAVFDGLGETVAITGSDDVTLVPGKYTLTASFRLGWFDHAKLVMKSNKYEIAENNNNAVLNAYFGSESIGELTINPDTWTELTYSFDITAPTKMSEFKFELDDVAALDYKIETVDVLAADRAAAQIVIDAIDKIADVTLDDGDAIATAEAAYEALTPTQKELVTNYETLTAARATYDALVVIANSVAKIGDTYYATLADALSAGGDVTLLKNIEEEVVVSKPVTIIKNGFKANLVEAEGIEIVDNEESYNVYEELEKVEQGGSNTTLGSSLALNFFINKKDLPAGGNNYAVLTIKYNDERATDSIKVYQSDFVDAGSSYKVCFEGLAAKEMNDEITAVFYNANGQQITNTKTDCIADNAMRALSHYQTRTDEKSKLMAQLYVDMLNYGAAAQAQFKYNTGDLANSELTEAQNALASELPEITNNSSKGPFCVGSSLSLEAEIQLSFIYYTEKVLGTKKFDGFYAIVTYTDHYGNEKEIRIEGSDGGFANYTTSGSQFKVPVVGMVVADYECMVTCKVYNKDGEMLSYATDSVESYAYRAMDKGTGAIKDTAAAIAKFAASTYAYLHIND